MHTCMQANTHIYFGQSSDWFTSPLSNSLQLYVTALPISEYPGRFVFENLTNCTIEYAVVAFDTMTT